MGVANFTGEAALISKTQAQSTYFITKCKKIRIECVIESVCVVDLNILLYIPYKLHTNATGLVVKNLCMSHILHVILSLFFIPEPNLCWSRALINLAPKFHIISGRLRILNVENWKNFSYTVLNRSSLFLLG